MARLAFLSFTIILLLGCGGKTFTNLGNGVGVPSDSVGEHADAHGVTRDEARARLRAESDEQRIAEYAEKHGISKVEAKRQIEHAAR